MAILETVKSTVNSAYNTYFNAVTNNFADAYSYIFCKNTLEDYVGIRDGYISFANSMRESRKVKGYKNRVKVNEKHIVGLVKCIQLHSWVVK